MSSRAGYVAPGGAAPGPPAGGGGGGEGGGGNVVLSSFVIGFSISHRRATPDRTRGTEAHRISPAAVDRSFGTPTPGPSRKQHRSGCDTTRGEPNRHPAPDLRQSCRGSARTHRRPTPVLRPAVRRSLWSTVTLTERPGGVSIDVYLREGAAMTTGQLISPPLRVDRLPTGQQLPIDLRCEP